MTITGLWKCLRQVLGDLAILRLKVEKKLPQYIWYENEIQCMETKAKGIYDRVSKMDENAAHLETKLREIKREIELIDKGIIVLNQHLDIDIQQKDQRERAMRGVFGGGGGYVGQGQSQLSTPVNNGRNGVETNGRLNTPNILLTPSASSSAAGSSTLGGGWLLYGTENNSGFGTPITGRNLEFNPGSPSVIPTTPVATGATRPILPNQSRSNISARSSTGSAQVNYHTV